MEGSAEFSLSTSSSRVMGSDLAESMAAPIATKNLESAGKIISSPVSPRVSINLFLSSERKESGPPRKATLPLIGWPHASPLMVWFTTAWNMDAARSSTAAPSLIKGWMSVLANTPQRAAIG